MRWLLTALLAASILAGCANTYKKSTAQKEIIHSIRMAYNNVHLLQSSHGNILIDAGTPKQAEELVSRLEKLGLKKGELSAIILTHGHYDHAGGAIQISDYYNAPIIAGSGDIELFKSGGKDKLCPRGFFARRIHKTAEAGRYEPFEPTHFVSSTVNLKDIVPDYSGEARIIPIPGHTKGAIAVKFEKFAFIGDLFRGGIFRAEATEHFFMCDTSDNKADIDLFLNTTSKNSERFYTGHFGTVSRESVLKLLESL